MGAAFVFALYVVVGGVLASVAALFLALVARRLTRTRPARVRRFFMVSGAVVPFACLAYGLCAVVAMAAFSMATGRDFGFGDGFDIPLANGYVWTAIDIPDSAYVYEKHDPHVDNGMGSIGVPAGYRTAFANVLALQQQGDWLAGSYGSHDSSFDSYGERRRVSDRWFLFNTRTHERIDAGGEVQLRAVAAAHGINLNLEPSEQFYGRRRWRWFDCAVALGLLVPAAGAVLVWWRAVQRVLRNAKNPLEPVP